VELIMKMHVRLELIASPLEKEKLDVVMMWSWWNITLSFDLEGDPAR
jgi:hypothetical protein